MLLTELRRTKEGQVWFLKDNQLWMSIGLFAFQIATMVLLVRKLSSLPKRFEANLLGASSFVWLPLGLLLLIFSWVQGSFSEFRVLWGFAVFCSLMAFIASFQKVLR